MVLTIRAFKSSGSESKMSFDPTRRLFVASPTGAALPLAASRSLRTLTGLGRGTSVVGVGVGAGADGTAALPSSSLAADSAAPCPIELRRLARLDWKRTVVAQNGARPTATGLPCRRFRATPADQSGAGPTSGRGQTSLRSFCSLHDYRDS